MQIKRQKFYQSNELARSVRKRVEQLRKKGELIDYLAFVPDGEPTLDINLGNQLELLRPLEIKLAVITNASLVWRKDVQRDLQKADLVCLKVDAITPDIWQNINRPNKKIKLDNILEGMLNFTGLFHGELISETMLIRGFNDSKQEVEKIAAFLAELKPAKAYLATPTRPPAERIEPANVQDLNIAYHTFNEKLNRVEFLTGYEGNAFISTGNIEDDLLSITAVHPMRKEAVEELCKKLGTGWDTVQNLINKGRLAELYYQGKKYYASKYIGNHSDKF